MFALVFQEYGFHTVLLAVSGSMEQGPEARVHRSESDGGIGRMDKHTQLHEETDR